MRIGLAIVFLPALAHAYPSDVIFSPNGEARDPGSVGLLAYTGTNLSPGVSAGSSWFGVEVGVLPHWRYGDKGVSFGCLEVGFNLVTPFGPSVKPVLDAKLGLVTEGIYTPSFALGIMEVAPGDPSMNFVYVATTKTLRANPDAFSYGRVTLGYGFAAGDRTTFKGTFPSPRSALMLCYESPVAFKRVGFAIDYLGGSSEISDLYTAVTLAISDTTTVAAGAFFATDRSVPAMTYDGVLAYLTTGFDATKLF